MFLTKLGLTGTRNLNISNFNSTTKSRVISLFFVQIFIEIEAIPSFKTKLGLTVDIGLVMFLVMFLASFSWVLRIVGGFGSF